MFAECPIFRTRQRFFLFFSFFNVQCICFPSLPFMLVYFVFFLCRHLSPSLFLTLSLPPLFPAFLFHHFTPTHLFPMFFPPFLSPPSSLFPTLSQMKELCFESEQTRFGCEVTADSSFALKLFSHLTQIITSQMKIFGLFWGPFSIFKQSNAFLGI